MPRFTCELRKKEDTFQVMTTKTTGEVFQIRSASGIGGATITCSEGMWPETIRIVFSGMQNLEHFKTEGNGIALEGFHRRDLKEAVYHFNERGEKLPDAKNSVYSLRFEFKKDEGMHVSLTTPAAARKTKTWKLEWIDAYR